MGANDFIRSLHGLRGIAVLYVLLSHFGINGLLLVPFLRYDHIGKIGVIIFFVLSAFLLTRKLSTDMRGPGVRDRIIGAYLVHRFFRIYPLFILVLLLHVITRHFDLHVAMQHLILQAGFRELWAIPIEFKYYFCMPIIAYCAVRFGLLPAISALLMCCSASFVYLLLDPAAAFGNGIDLMGKLLPFLLGSVAALALDGGQPLAWWRWTVQRPVTGWLALTVLICATVAFRARHAEDLPDFWSPWILLATSGAAAVLIHVALHDNIIGRIFSNKALVFLGEISFSIYLLHEFIAKWVTSHLGQPRLLAAWAALLLVLLLSWLSYMVIERTGIKIGYRLGDKILGKRK